MPVLPRYPPCRSLYSILPQCLTLVIDAFRPVSLSRAAILPPLFRSRHTRFKPAVAAAVGIEGNAHHIIRTGLTLFCTLHTVVCPSPPILLLGTQSRGLLSSIRQMLLARFVRVCVSPQLLLSPYPALYPAQLDYEMRGCRLRRRALAYEPPMDVQYGQ